MTLASLSPLGPIFTKELRVASRRRRNYVLRVLYLGALLLFLLLAWSITRESYSYGAVARQQQQEQLGWMFFMFFSMFSVCAMGLIGPVLTSTAINQERDAKTFHVLLMTPLSAWQIVSGKLLSRLLTALTLIGLSLPVLALVRLLGGVELAQMFGIICLACAVAMSSAAIGLLLSILLRRAYAVIILSYLTMGLMYLFIPAMLAMLMMSRAGPATFAKRQFFQIVAAINPFWTAGWIASGQARIMAVSWIPSVVGQIALTAVLLVIGSLLLRRLARREGERGDGARREDAPVPAPSVDAGVPSEGPSPNGILAAGDAVTPAPDRPRRRREQTVSDHPVLWRELRRPLMNSRRQRIAGTLACMILLSLTYVAGSLNDALGDRDTQIGYAFVFYTLLMLLACVISATAIAQEKESDQWTVLLSSPLSGSAIVWGKAIGAARRLLWPMALVGAHFLVFTLAGIISPLTFVTVIVVTVLFNVIWIATGVSLSLRCAKVTLAVIVNLMLPVLLYGGLSMLLAAVEAWLRGARGLTERVEWWLPYYYLAEGIDAGGSTGSPRLPGPHAVRASQQEFLIAATTVGLIHLSAAAAILWATARRFNAITSRAPQRDLLPQSVPPRFSPQIHSA